MDSYLVSSTFFTLKISILLVIHASYSCVLHHITCYYGSKCGVVVYQWFSSSMCESPFLLLLMMGFKSLLIRDISLILHTQCNFL